MFKRQYQHLMLRKLISEMAHCDDVSELISKITLFHAVDFLKQSWSAVSATTVKNCFERVGVRELQGLLEDDDVEMQADEEETIAGMLQQLSSDMTEDEYLRVDETAPVFEDEDNAEIDDEAIFDLVNPPSVVDEEDEVQLVEIEPKKITDDEAAQCVATLLQYIKQQPELHESHFAVQEIERKITRRQLGNMTQKKITDFFHTCSQ